uniref:Ribosomal protein S18 n=1 Tax=Climaconeis cf. scalaris TaxID=2846828 RepID=A0A8F8X806_9STRA|nr:ribosomal protein S18 [Climaconeis cf. scalaris]
MLSKKPKKRNLLNTISLDQKISYKNIDLLTLFISEQGKILPRRVTGVTIQQQRKLAKAIKRGRILALFPFVIKIIIF